MINFPVQEGSRISYSTYNTELINEGEIKCRTSMKCRENYNLKCSKMRECLKMQHDPL